MNTTIIKHGDKYMAMKWEGFLFWKSWQPISWELHPTHEAAAKEARDWEFYHRCKSKSSAI